MEDLPVYEPRSSLRSGLELEYMLALENQINRHHSVCVAVQQCGYTANSVEATDLEDPRGDHFADPSELPLLLVLEQL